MALDPDRTRIEIAHSVTPGEVPTGLEVGEPAVNLVDTPPRLYVGGSAGPILLNGSQLPIGGTQYEVLSKASATDHDVAWRGAGVRPNNNIAIGAGALTNTNGYYNIAIGEDALTNVVSYYNVAIGREALAVNADQDNVAVGYRALRRNQWARGNVAVGSVALENSEDASNVAVGAQALMVLVTGSESVAVGHAAMRQLTAGSQNVAIGRNTGTAHPGGFLTSANRSIYIGFEASASMNNPNNEIVIGSSAGGNGSNTITLGNADITALHTQGTIYVDGKKIGGFAPSIAWTANTNPDGASFFVNNTGRTLNVAAISWIVEELNGSAASVIVVKAASLTPISGGTPIHGVPLDADDRAGEIQDIIPTLSMTLLAGERLGLQATSVSGWEDSVASITVYLEP